jgi:hypothetical protein
MLSLSSCVQVESVANITRTNMDGLNNMNNTSNMSNTLLNLSKTQIKKQKTIKICGYFRENQYLCIINNDK